MEFSSPMHNVIHGSLLGSLINEIDENAFELLWVVSASATVVPSTLNRRRPIMARVCRILLTVDLPETEILRSLSCLSPVYPAIYDQVQMVVPQFDLLGGSFGKLAHLDHPSS